jgi:hypothetical protein
VGAAARSSADTGDLHRRARRGALLTTRRASLLAAWLRTVASQGARRRAAPLAPRPPRPRRAQEAAEAARLARRQAAAQRADQALLLCELEGAWPSAIVQPYPRGTFGGSP